jgi:hypothetical protein
MIALNIQRSLEVMLPDPAVRPMERIGHRSEERKRARQSSANRERPGWSWGDGEDDLE